MSPDGPWVQVVIKVGSCCIRKGFDRSDSTLAVRAWDGEFIIVLIFIEGVLYESFRRLHTSKN